MLRRATYLLPLFLGLVIGGLILAGSMAEEESYVQKARLQVFYKLSSIQNGFESALNTKLNIANGLRSYIAQNPDIDQEAFAALAAGLVRGATGIRFLELARDNVVTHMYPDKSGNQVVGRNLMKDFPGDIRDITMRAMETRQDQMTGPRKLIEGGEALIGVTPVYLEGHAPSASTYWGLVAVFIDANSLYREAGLVDSTPGLELALRKPVKATGESRLLVGQPAVFDLDPVIMNIPTADGYWQVAAIPTGGWPSSPNKPYIIGGGLAATLMIMASLWAALLMVQGRLKERERYLYLIQNAKSIILRIDMAGNIVFCNDHAEEFYGYGPGELLGKPIIGTLIPEKNLEGKSMKRFVSRLLRNPSAHPFNETMNVRKNGEIVWVAWANKAVEGRDGKMTELLSVGTDITDRKLMEEALRQRERQYRVLAENVTDVIWGLDADFRYTYVSPSDETLRGFERHNVLGRPVSDFLTPASNRLLGDVMSDLENDLGNGDRQSRNTLDLEFLCSDGTTVWLETRLGVMRNEDGEKIGFQGVGRDISDRKLAEALRDDVERMAKHDLKTPLGAVIGLPGEIRRLGELSASQVAMLHTIEEAGEAMLQLINRSLDLFKMERGTYALSRKNVNVLAVIERIKTETRPMVREKGISIGMELMGGLPDDSFIVHVEEDLFRSMLSNLVLNAMQASPEGGAVSIALEKGDGTSITIRNQGEVPASIRDRFFEKYSSDNSGGTGLGTYSARLIARTHGGDIVVDTSIPGETCVVVRLPA